jgi:DNA repair exonuclease SbcCD ATPase subunit
VEDAVGKYDTISELRTTIEQEQNTIQHARDRIDDLNSQIARLQDEKDDIEEQLGDKDVEDLREDLDRVNTRIEQRQETRDEYQEELQETRDERTRLETELDALRETKAQIELYEDKEQWAQEVYDELDAAISVYESTKSDLREQYLAYINEYTNDIFKEIYKNSSYQQVIIEETYDDQRDSYEYDIRLLRDDGTTEDPSNASGGERAIVNLALRAGIYKLIAELHGGNRGQLPPFILDEPTTFLDEGHVGQLEQMLTTIKEWDVPQIIVVSHDEALIHGADHECHVTIDESDNTSQITMRTAGTD